MIGRERPSLHQVLGELPWIYQTLLSFLFSQVETFRVKEWLLNLGAKNDSYLLLLARARFT